MKIAYKIKSIIVKPCKLFQVYILDYFHYYKYSHGGLMETKRDYIETSILLNSHALEKGLSFENKKQNWGKEKASYLCKLVEMYTVSYNTINDICILALNVLAKYKEDLYASKDKILINNIDKLTTLNNKYIVEGQAGVKEIKKPIFFNKTTITDFFFSRSSVRNYSDRPVTDDEIHAAMQIANTTPTTCNRQAARAYVLRDKTVMQKILDYQLGDQGWCTNAKVLFIITVNQSRFGGVYERSQSFIDGGLFAMNLVHGLHLNLIASCFKMFIRDPKLQKQFYRICNIPKKEIPIVLILAGHYKDETTKGPVSHRFNGECSSLLCNNH